MSHVLPVLRGQWRAVVLALPAVRIAVRSSGARWRSLAQLRRDVKFSSRVENFQGTDLVIQGVASSSTITALR